MFEHLRAELQARLDVVQGPVEQAAAALAAAQTVANQTVGRVAAAQAALNTAQLNAQQANTNLATAQGVVNQRDQARAAAQSRRDAAAAAVADHAEKEPDRFGSDGKLNPAWKTWNTEMTRLQHVADQAEEALTAAKAALAQAVPPRDAVAQAAKLAANAVAASQTQLTTAITSRDAAAQRVAQTTADLAIARQAVAQQTEQLNEQITALDAREARILAEPLKRDDLELAADAELADLSAWRHERRDRYDQRVSARAERATTLASQDATIDDARAIRHAVSSWPEAGRYPELAQVLTALDQVIAASATQRTRPVNDRSDDIWGARTVFAEQVQHLQAAIGKATTERAHAEKDLTTSGEVLAKHQQAKDDL